MLYVQWVHMIVLLIILGANSVRHVVVMMQVADKTAVVVDFSNYDAELALVVANASSQVIEPKETRGWLAWTNRNNA